jgi:hypothetical protein
MGAKTLLDKLGSHLRRERELGAKIAGKHRGLQAVLRQVIGRGRSFAGLRAGRVLNRRSGGGRDREMPVFFIVGHARSGTTWLRTILNSHPEILCRGEGRFFERNFWWEDFQESQLKNIPPSSLYGAILESKYLKAWVERSVWAPDEDTERHLTNLTRMTIDYFLVEQLSKTNKRIVGDKTPFGTAEAVEDISEIYPDAKVIHIIRDGRDVAVSVVHHIWNYAKNEGGMYDLEPEELEKRNAYREGSMNLLSESLFTEERLAGIARDWNTKVGKATEDGPTLLGSNYTEVRYEDILERPVEEVAHLLKFLGGISSEVTAKRCVEATGFEVTSNRERGQEDSSSRSRKGVAGDWKNIFTEEDRRIFKENAGDLLIKLGYEEDNNW